MRSHTLAGNGGMREGRVLSRTRPATPARMNRSCQRHTVTLLVSAHDLIGADPVPCEQYDLRPPNMFLWAVPVHDDRLQARPIGRAYL